MVNAVFLYSVLYVICFITGIAGGGETGLPQVPAAEGGNDVDEMIVEDQQQALNASDPIISTVKKIPGSIAEALLEVEREKLLIQREILKVQKEKLELERERVRLLKKEVGVCRECKLKILFESTSNDDLFELMN